MATTTANIASLPVPLGMVMPRIRNYGGSVGFATIDMNKMDVFPPELFHKVRSRLKTRRNRLQKMM